MAKGGHINYINTDLGTAIESIGEPSAMMDRKKVLELDKICRVCISERKEMRPLFSEKVPEMLMDCTSVRVEPTEGWPDKICVQCVHAVSRNHAFKSLVERSDKELREYIKTLTVRLVLDESLTPQERKQQKLLQKQIKQQQLLEEQQQKLEQQIMQQQEQLQQQQQQQPPIYLLQQPQQQQQKPFQQQPIKNKLKPLLRKGSSPRQSKKQMEASQLLPEPAPPPLPPPLMTQHQQQIQQIQLPTLQPAPAQLMPTTTQQQILLPNGQFITTQIVAPQLAQIISTGPQTTTTNATATTSAQAQFLPQLLQAPNGQTLQIVHQPNGTQTLQLVQIVPQRSMAQTSTTDMCTNSSGASLADADVQLLDDGEMDDEELEEVYDQLDSKHTFETIVLDDDQQQDFLKEHQQHQVLIDEDLTQSDTQEPEHEHEHDEYFDEQLLQHDDGVKHEEDEDDNFIIEEIQLDDEDMLEDADGDMDGDAMTPVDDCEYITDEQEHVGLAGDVDDELQYAIMEPTDGDVSPTDIEQAFIDVDAQQQQQLHEQQHHQSVELHNITLENAVVEFSQDALVPPALQVSTPSPTPSAAKRSRRSNQQQQSNLIEQPCNHHQPTINYKIAAANSRQLVQTASVIAAAGPDDNYEIDANLVTDFIRQHTSPLGSGRYICHLCNTEFRQFRGLQNHMHSHTNWIRANCKKQPQCEICQKSFKGPGMLRMHMKTHDAETNTPVCNICNRTFKSKAILYRHRQTHQQRAYCCGVANCRKNFSNAANLRWHVERKHPECVEPFYKCGECLTLYDNIDSLQHHVENTDHGIINADQLAATGSSAAFSGAVSIVSNGTDITNMIAAAPTTLAGAGGGPGDTHAVVVGSSGEMYFVTQA